jgi:hypothetical protein
MFQQPFLAFQVVLDASVIFTLTIVHHLISYFKKAVVSFLKTPHLSGERNKAKQKDLSS